MPLRDVRPRRSGPEQTPDEYRGIATTDRSTSGSSGESAASRRLGGSVLPSFFRLLPKAATQALIALAVTGGAIGVSAAAGGPNVPNEALQAVGLVNEANEHAEDNGKSTAPGQIKKAAATGTPGGQAGDNGLKGLCTAYSKGGLGQRAQVKGEGTPAAAPLARLDDARGSQSIADFCATLLEEHAGGAGADNPGVGKALGKSGQAPGKSGEAPGKSR